MVNVAQILSEALAGRYVVDREIGAGGTAIVLRVHDVRHERYVALKVLRPELSSSLGAERFLREIRLAAGLQHPHILPLHDSGDAGGLLYYVMPYVEGESLRSRLEREGQLPLDEALRIAREVADALHYAHQRNIVHRDIKPENILLSGETGEYWRDEPPRGAADICTLWRGPARRSMTTDLRDRLQATLTNAYTVDRALGGAGMSCVFVATDVALGRRVVVKDLPPELDRARQYWPTFLETFAQPDPEYRPLVDAARTALPQLR